MKPMPMTALVLTISLAASGCASLINATSDEPIDDNPGTRTTGSFIDDEVLEIKALVNLNKASPALEDAHLVVVAYNGVVLLAGQVPTQEAKKLAAETLQKIRKVRVVHNELKVAGPTSALVRTSDAWLSTKIKAKMLVDKRIGATRIKVVSENGVVYLMGLVSRAEGETAVNLVRETPGVQKVVKIFEYIQ